MQSQTFQRLLVPRFTPFRAISGEDLSYTKVAQQLAEDDYRNLFIVKDVIEALKEGRSPIILTSRTAHVDVLANLLKPHCPNVITLVGSESTKEKRQKMERLQSIPLSEPLIIVATGKYVGEGFDYARLDTLFLVSPVAWKGIVQLNMQDDCIESLKVSRTCKSMTTSTSEFLFASPCTANA